MLEHRFQHLLEPAETPVAFVPCPLVSLCPPAQQSFVQAVYQLAAERTREQLTPPRPAFRMPTFSLN
jgi:hypothetical protein